MATGYVAVYRSHPGRHGTVTGVLLRQSGMFEQHEPL